VANINACLIKASSEIDRYVGVRYALPLAVVPDDLKRVCCDIAMYWLCPTAVTQTDLKRDRYKDAISFLRDLSTGKATLGIAQNQDEPAVLPEVHVPQRGLRLTDYSLRRIL